jgi:hypothetical protein
MIRGATQEEAEARIAERRRINKEAEKIVGKPIHAWPLFAMEWDTHPSSYHFSQDGVDYEALDGSNVTLMWVTLSELDAVLQAWNLRTAEEVWSIGDNPPTKRAMMRNCCRRCATARPRNCKIQKLRTRRPGRRRVTTKAL